MTRPPSPPSFTGLPLSQLLQYASDDSGAGSSPPKVWFERACYNADKAKLAERKQSKQDMFVSYSRACQSYINVAMHNDWPDVKKKDPQLAARVKDFKPVCAFLLLPYTSKLIPSRCTIHLSQRPRL